MTSHPRSTPADGAPRTDGGGLDAAPVTARQLVRRLAPSIYIPTVLESAGEMALLPVIPLLAIDLGFSVPQAAALTMIAGIGAVLGPVPVGRIMIAFGARRAIVASGILLTLANVAALLILPGGLDGTPEHLHRVALVTLLVIMAATSQVWSLGRQSYLGTELPAHLRARGMTTFGGMIRAGQVVGPLLGAVVLALGHEAWVFGLFALLSASATTMVALFMVPGEERHGSAGEHREHPVDMGDVASESMVRTVGTASDETATSDAGRDEAAPGGDLEAAVARTAAASAPELPPEAPGPRGRAVLARMVSVGAGVTPIVMGRINRPVIVPLLGAALGLDPLSISIVFGIAAVVEIIMFVPAGTVMDTKGRAAVAVPCSLVMGVGYVLLAVLAPALAGGSYLGTLAALVVPCMLIAVGNGLGSGIVMTLGVDVSPERGRTRYLAWWNTVIGVGRLTAPLLVSAITLVAPVAVAGAVSGALCLAGAGWLARVLPGITPEPGGPRSPDGDPAAGSPAERSS